MTLAEQLREALERGRRRPADAPARRRARRRRRQPDARGACWCRSSTAPSRRSSSPSGRRRCAATPARSPFPAAASIPGDDGPIAAALREAEEEIGLPPRRGRGRSASPTATAPSPASRSRRSSAWCRPTCRWSPPEARSRTCSRCRSPSSSIPPTSRARAVEWQGRSAHLLRDRLGRTAHLGRDGGDDRQPVAPAGA